MAPLRDFLARHDAAVRITLTRVRGSAPRTTGTEMYVALSGIWGTIGGGQLEYMAIDRARDMLRGGVLNADMDVPLGPEIGQCCGGRVEMTLAQMRQADRAQAIARANTLDHAQPSVYILGAGHVGRALAAQLQHMPVRCVLIDTRADELALCDAQVETRLSALPEADIATAPAGSAFVVLTHDHALDFLLTSAALQRSDAAYVGMIGSATKRAKFRNWTRQHCDGQTIDQLTCPIGASGSRDKRPSLIAAFVVAEVMAELTSETAAQVPQGTFGRSLRDHQTDQQGACL